MAPKKGALLLAAMAAQLAVFWGTAAEANGSFMLTSGRATQPVGHYDLCQSRPVECAQKTARPQPVELTRALWAKMIQVNNSVNSAVVPRTDQEMWGREEVWSYPDQVGDCEDYVLEKRRELMRAGVPAGNLLITVVRQPNGDGHAVLSVNTDHGDFVMDNLDGRVLTWTDTPYTFLKRQSSKNSGIWVSISDGRAVAVGSVR
jgi:predicted transglutaminase-like cysteine proteinase